MKTKSTALTQARRRVVRIRNRVLANAEHHRKYTVFLRKGAAVSAHTRGPCWVVRSRA